MSAQHVDPALRESLRSAPTVDDMEARRTWLRHAVGEGHEPGADVRVDDWSIARPDPTALVLGLRVFTPSATGALPVVLYCHGGGFALNDHDINDVLCRDIAAAAECVVVAVDYRLSPAHRYPAALDDCFTTLRWIDEFAHVIGVDARRVAMVGVSAGGALAAATTLAARDRGGPSVAYLQLVNPILDDRMATDSAQRFTDTPMMNRDAAQATWNRYLSSDVSADMLAAPGRCTDCTGMPPTYLEVAQYDPLRDEGLAFAARLLAAGTAVEIHLFAGTFHGSELFVSADVSQRASTVRIAALRQGLAFCASEGAG